MVGERSLVREPARWLWCLGPERFWILPQSCLGEAKPGAPDTSLLPVLGDLLREGRPLCQALSAQCGGLRSSCVRGFGGDAGGAGGSPHPGQVARE